MTSVIDYQLILVLPGHYAKRIESFPVVSRAILMLVNIPL